MILEGGGIGSLRGKGISVVSYTATCPYGSKEFNGMCYTSHMDEHGVDSAEERCQDVQGGHLASIHSQEEYDFLRGIKK